MPIMEPLVSVVVPVYNVARYIEKCVMSVLGQTYRNLQVILIDDGSTDGSSSICDSLAASDSRAAVIHQANSGVGTARNRGIQAADGEYLIFLDADDWIETGMLEKMVNTAEQSQADMVVCSAAAHVDSSRDRYSRQYYRTQKSLTVQDGFWSWDGTSEDIWAQLNHPGRWPFVWNKLFRSSFLKENHITFQCGLPLGEDGLFMLIAMQYARRISFLSDRFYHYRFNRKESATIMHSRQICVRFAHHIAVVQALLHAFYERKLWDENVPFLLHWLVQFLYTDYIRISPAEHPGFACPLQEMAGQYHLLDHESELPAWAAKRLRSMAGQPKAYPRAVRNLRVLLVKIQNRFIKA